MSLWHIGLAEFRDRTASDAPTPGGGSAAMVSATIGLGLVIMALRVSIKRADRPELLEQLIVKGERLLNELSAHVDADVAVFEAYMDALKLPRETDEHKQARRQRLAEAAVAATEVPLNAAQSTLEALELARQAMDMAHKSIVSDAGAGGAILHGALTAVLYNVDINLGSIRNAEDAESYRTSRAHLQRAADQRHAVIRKLMQERLSD
ncbi:MAG: cyclodeaminase/cyclohydrolase family protein [Pseudomonadota bacterium]